MKVIVVAAPPFGFSFSRAGLRGPHVPNPTLARSRDRYQPNSEYEEAIRLGSRQAPEYYVIPAAGRYDVLPLCSVRLAEHNAQMCADVDGFDRGKFLNEFNAAIVRFFEPICIN